MAWTSFYGSNYGLDIGVNSGAVNVNNYLHPGNSEDPNNAQPWKATQLD